MDDKIVGGYECAAHSQPWQVSINIGYHYCGGSLINDQWIISAAHCWQKCVLCVVLLTVSDLNSKYYFAVCLCFSPYSQIAILGDHHIWVHEGTEQYMSVDAIYWHEQYDYRTLDYDIMLLKLAHPVTQNQYVRPITLPQSCPTPGEMCTVSGWGNIYSDDGEMFYRFKDMTPNDYIIASNQNLKTHLEQICIYNYEDTQGFGNVQYNS